ncbi:MAG TPA: cytochrome c [Pseudolabrys sp.]|jgi:mono/diheme cytochrome c family protein|nr:cytochrome c [Pseudolabrys sp.]
MVVLAASAVLPLVSARAADTSFAQIERGRNLVNAGDCVACHTPDKGKPFAGGRAIETPFGTIYSANITPDQDTGIGAWSEDDFYRAMHEGRRPDGSRLYPAFPYPYFTKLTRDDVTAIHAYLKTLQPVRNPRRANELKWGLNHRVFMRGWDMLFFKPGTFKPDPNKSAEWNRGAYLVEGAGHCGACHTPKNALGADKTSEALNGGVIQDWFAPRIANNMRDGTGAWSVDDIAEYLKTGRNKHSGATGLMSEVVRDSTSKLSDDDLKAIATYIKDVDGGPNPPPPPAPPKDKKMSAGEAIFADSCSACHQADGSGVPRMFPPLAGNANVQSRDPTTIIRVILQGAQTAPTDKAPTAFSMPAFDWKLDDGQIAAVASYVRNTWGNSAPPVGPDQVGSLRKAVRQGHATQ